MKAIIDINDIDKEIEVLHLMAQLAELVNGDRSSHKLDVEYTLHFQEERVVLVHQPQEWTEIALTIISAKVDKDRVYDSSNSDAEPYMMPGNIYLYNDSNLTTFKEFESTELENSVKTHEVVLEDFRDPSSESTLFQLSTLLEPEVLLGVVLNSQMYNFLMPDMVHYRRTALRNVKIPYDVIIPALVKVIEERHGR